MKIDFSSMTFNQIHMIKNEQETSLSVHDSEAFYLFYVTAGSIQIIQKNCAHFLSNGQFIFVKSSDTIHIRSNQKQKYIVLDLNFSINENIDQDIFNNVFSSDVDSDLYFKSILSEYENKSEDYVQVLTFNIASLLIIAHRMAKIRAKMNSCKENSYNCIRLNTATNQQSIIDNCLRLIKDNLNNPDLNVSFLTDNLYISPAYLHKIFNKYMHTSINKYIQNMRMKRATFLLKDSVLSITVISEMLGFCSQCYFSYQFKKVMNITPSEFRMENAVNS